MNIITYNKWFKNKKYPYSSDTIKNYKDEEGHSVDLAFVLGGRNLGKSFEISAKLLMNAWDSKGKNGFGYIRRYSKEMTVTMVESYFGDKTEFIKDLTGGEFDSVQCYRQYLYFAKKDPVTALTKRSSFAIGAIFALNTSTQYKSLQYPDIHSLLFEEVFATKYLADEGRLLLNLISTIKRDKEDFITYLVANTVSRVNPYTAEFCLNKLARQKPGTIETYKLMNGLTDDDGNDLYYLIAVEYLNDENTKKKINTIASTITNEWDEAKRYPVLNAALAKEFPTTYSSVLEYGEFRFLIQVKQVPINLQAYTLDETGYMELNEEKMEVLYIEKKTTPVLPNTRLYTNLPIISPNVTRGFKCTNNQDNIVHDLIVIGWAFFSDNLTGNEFMECYKKMR